MNARVLGGFSAIGVAWLAWAVCLVLMMQEWKGHLSEIFPGEGQKQSDYVRHRSRFSLAVYFGVLLYFSSIGRTLTVCQLVLKLDTTSRLAELATISYVLLIVGFINLIRAWTLRLRFQYYVVLANSDWTKLLDSSLNTSSFWVRWKSFLTSETVIAAILGSVCVMWGVVMVLFHRQTVFIRTLSLVIFLAILLLALPVLRNIDETSSFEKTEVIVLNLGLIFLTVLGGLTLNVVRNVDTATLINQFLLIIMTSMQFLVSFVWIPRKIHNRERNVSTVQSQGHSTVLNSRERVYQIMGDVQLLSSFMKFCCENWCSESVLCLLELREFKRQLRAQIRDDDQHSDVVGAGSSALSTNNPPLQSRDSGKNRSSTLKPTLSLRTSASNSNSSRLESKLSEHKKLVSRMKSREQFQSGFFDESLCSWDLHCKVSLSQLGCQSSIVSNKDRTLSDKARLLCEKYFEYTSQYCVNVSESSRRVILSLVGEHSTVADSLDSLVFLFLFDEAVKDLIDNLNDSLIRFYEIKNDRSK